MAQEGQPLRAASVAQEGQPLRAASVAQEGQPLRAVSVALAVVLGGESGVPALLWAGFRNGLALQGAVQHGGEVVWGTGGPSSASQDPWVPSEIQCSCPGSKGVSGLLRKSFTSSAGWPTCLTGPGRVGERTCDASGHGPGMGRWPGPGCSRSCPHAADGYADERSWLCARLRSASCVQALSTVPFLPGRPPSSGDRKHGRSQGSSEGLRPWEQVRFPPRLLVVESHAGPCREMPGWGPLPSGPWPSRTEGRGQCRAHSWQTDVAVLGVFRAEARRPREGLMSLPQDFAGSWAESRLDQERRLGRRAEAELCPAPGRRGSGWRLSGLFRG